MPMKKGHDLSNSPGSCEKVFSCIFCCKCQTNYDTDHQQDHMGASGGRNHLQPTHLNHAGKARDMGHESRYEQPSKAAHFAVNRTEPDAKHEGKRSSGLTKNDTFSNYIHRAKMRIRAGPHHGSEMKASEASNDNHIHTHDDTKKDNNAKDGFSDYIDRVKLKIRRTTTSVRSWKS